MFIVSVVEFMYLMSRTFAWAGEVANFKSKFASSFANWLPNLEVRYVVSSFPTKFASARGKAI